MSDNGIKKGSAYTVADCGVFAALTTVLVLISTYVPLIGLAASLVWAVPVIVVVLRRGLGAGITVSVVVLLLSLLFTGPVTGVIAGLTVGVFGIVYGICFKKQVSPAKTLFAGTVAAGVITVITLGLSVALTNLPISNMIETMEETFRSVFQQYDEMGLLSQILPAGVSAQEYIDNMMAVFRRILPGAFVVSAMAMAALNYIFASIILKKMRFDIVPLPAFREWHFPWWIMWGLVPVLLGYLMGKQLEGEYYFAIAQNILYIYLPLFLISGISLLSYFFHTWGLTTGTKVVIWVLCLLFASFTMVFLVIMGAVDVLFDYRKYVRKVKEKSKK